MNARQSGFSLLEVIVALAILTVGISSALALFTGATRSLKRSVDRTHSAAIAEHAMADIESALARGVDPESLMTAPPFAEIERNWPGYAVAVNVRAIEGDTADDELLIELRIRWKTAGSTREQIFRQLVARESRIWK